VNNGSLQSGALISLAADTFTNSDCNADGILDAYQISLAILIDSNSDGVAYCCEPGVFCTLCAADINGNNEVNGIHLAFNLDGWGACP
jgi:hypothetical protein